MAEFPWFQGFTEPSFQERDVQPGFFDGEYLTERLSNFVSVMPIGGTESY
jgi:hypothetical protein